MNRSILVFIVTVFGSTGAASAIPNAKFGKPSFSGTGCPASTGKASVDESKVTLTLERFEVVAKADRALTRATCNLSVPIQVESGQQVAVRSLAIFGKSQLSPTAKAEAQMELFFAGTRGNPKTENIRTDASTLALNHRLAESELQWTACGAQPIARANVSLVLRSGTKSDTVKVENLTLELVSRKCP